MKYIFFVILFAVLTMSSCGRGKQAETSGTTTRSLNITIDPRFELLLVVQLLSGYGERTGLITPYNFPYKKDVIKYFSPYKEHPAVQMFTELGSHPHSFVFNAPPEIMLCLSDPPELRQLYSFPRVSALRATNNVKSDAARMLSIPESTLRSKIKKLNITL